MNKMTVKDVENEITAVKATIQIHTDQVTHNQKGILANDLILRLLNEELSKMKASPSYIN